MLDVVVVGPGLIGKKHIQLIHNNSRCRLVAIVAPDQPQDHEIARQNGVPLFHDLAECLARSMPDAVIIASPNEFHYDQAKTCVCAGVAVLVEKPVTATLEEALSLSYLVTDLNGKLLVGHHREHNPLLAKAREVIVAGRLGQLISVMGSAQFYKPDDYFEAGPWRKVEGGGPILINLIHEIDNLRCLCGEISAVQAIASSAARHFAVEDTVAINLLFANGVLGVFMLSDVAATSRSWEQTTGENTVYPYYPTDNCYVISGTRGSLSVPTLQLKYFSDKVEPSWWTPFAEELVAVEQADPLVCQLEHFLDMTEGKTKPLVSVEDGYRNMCVIEAIRKSARDKCLVEV